MESPTRWILAPITNTVTSKCYGHSEGSNRGRRSVKGVPAGPWEGGESSDETVATGQRQ